LKIFKKTSIFLLILMMSMGVFLQSQKVNAAEGGIVLGVSGMQGRQIINASGIKGTTNYPADGMSFTFRYALNFVASIRALSTAFQFEVEPALAPYVDHIMVTGQQKLKGNFIVLATMPGQFYFSIADVAKAGYAIIDIVVYLKCPISSLPNPKYAYGLGLVDTRLGYQYVLKTRFTGIVEKKPTQYVTLDKHFGLEGSYLGFYLGRPLPSDNIIELQYNVYEKCYAYIKKSNFVYKFDPCLAEFVDHVDFYNECTHMFVMSSDMTYSGVIRIPVQSVFARPYRDKYWPLQVKIYLKDGYTLADITQGTFAITVYAELASSHGIDILKDSLCTIGIYTGACADPNASYVDQSNTTDLTNLTDYTDLSTGAFNY